MAKALLSIFILSFNPALMKAMWRPILVTGSHAAFRSLGETKEGLMAAPKPAW